MTVTAAEYWQEKDKFFKKHKHDFETHTSAMNEYTIAYKMYDIDREHYITVTARNKALALYTADNYTIPEIEGEAPYSIRVEAVTYQNGNIKYFKET